MSSRARRAALPLLAGCCAAFGPAGAAQASDATLKATVKSDVPKLLRSQAKIIDGLAALAKTSSVKPLVKAIRAQDRDLTSLRRRLAAESASSTTGTRAKADITKGLALIVTANSTLSKDLAKASSGKAVSKAQVKAAAAAVKRGNVDVATGVKLLKKT